MNLASILPALLATAWLLPLLSFTLIVLFGPRLGKHGVAAAWVATAAIVSSCVLSLVALMMWIGDAAPQSAERPAHAVHDKSEAGEQEKSAEHAGTQERGEHAAPKYFAGDWYSLGRFGTLTVNIGYYIDSLTVSMFAMVSLIASLIHFYAIGYMHDELHDVDDHEVILRDGHHLHRPGRFSRFFQYLSLFCFSMLGLVISGNIAMVFVFWELVGICSYFLIGFYVERKSASTAANKAFIVNRIGDFGMIVGLMALWSSLGTFAFGDTRTPDGKAAEPGIFSLVRAPQNHYQIKTPDGMVRLGAAEEIGKLAATAGFISGDSQKNAEIQNQLSAQIDAKLNDWRDDKEHHYGYWLLILAGFGIFCGCVGKSAQFPLHVWLPDAMEGPTPVSALVHSATMVAAGVYLVGRFYPVFTPEVLWVIAWIGAITLLLAATIAITATDIKRVLAYSTVSQLGYMMFALGIGGWVAGLFHLLTHAFFKSLLFMCSGSVIHACHTNEMPRMGGLRKKMPYTAYTMLVGCLAIAGAGIPFVIGFSGYYSKDAIIAQALSFKASNPHNFYAAALFYIAAGGAAVTAFYMFRLWYMTFAGEPRDHHVYEHAHESPKVMYVPLVILAVFATIIGWRMFNVEGILGQSQPAGTAVAEQTSLVYFASPLIYPIPHAAHEYHGEATIIAFSTALAGFLLATLFYGTRQLKADEAKNYFKPVYVLFRNKWYFDELYELIFVQPVMFISRRIAEIDRDWIDGLIHTCAHAVKMISSLDDLIDRLFVDGLVNMVAGWTHSLGLALRGAQTGRLRQYVMFIVVGTVGLFVLISFFLKSSLAAP